MGIFSYKPLKEGKGVSEDEPQLRSGLLFFSRFGRKIWSIIKLNFLFLVCCLPVITIGASLSGMTYVLKCYINDDHAFILHDFFCVFKENFLKATAMLIINGVVFYSFFIVYSNYGIITAFNPMLIPSAFVSVLVLIMDFYFFPMLVTYDIGFGGLIKNSFIFALIKLPQNIIAAALVIAVAYLAATYLAFVGLILALIILPAFVWMFAIFYNRNYIKSFLEPDEN